MTNLLGQLGKNQIFIVDAEVNERRKYKPQILDPHDENFAEAKNDFGLLKMDLNKLVDVFIDELKVNLTNNKSNLINFKIFSCLKPEE